jgi:hypothetical protein
VAANKLHGNETSKERTDTSRSLPCNADISACARIIFLMYLFIQQCSISVYINLEKKKQTGRRKHKNPQNKNTNQRELAEFAEKGC